jgi:hypothetical protein
MLGELLSVLLLGPLTACDTARAAIGSCSTQLSAGVVPGSGFALNLSRELVTPGAVTNTPGQANAPVTTPKPAVTSPAAPKPAVKPAAKPTPSQAVAKPVVVPPTTGKPGVCGAGGASLIGSFIPDCVPSKPAPSAIPAAVKTSKPNPVQPALAKPLPQPAAAIGVAPPRSTATVSNPQTSRAQDSLAGYAPPVLLEAFGDNRVGLPVDFLIRAGSAQTRGQLLGTEAVIRFSPTTASISFGDGVFGQGLSHAAGFQAKHTFLGAGSYWVQARVSYRVDYQLGGGDWVLGAAVIDVSSNQLLIELSEPRRRTLLVN